MKLLDDHLQVQCEQKRQRLFLVNLEILENLENLQILENLQNLQNLFVVKLLSCSDL